MLHYWRQLGSCEAMCCRQGTICSALHDHCLTCWTILAQQQSCLAPMRLSMGKLHGLLFVKSSVLP